MPLYLRQSPQERQAGFPGFAFGLPTDKAVTRSLERKKAASYTHWQAQSKSVLRPAKVRREML